MRAAPALQGALGMSASGVPSQSSGGGPDGIVFYDGECAMCHGFVRFALERDREGRFRFAPLHGASFAALVPAEARGALPDSVVVRTPGGELLVRSRAVRYVLARLGGIWPALGHALGALPERLLDRLYDGIAALRKRVFRRPGGSCPLVAPTLRQRFLD